MLISDPIVRSCPRCGQAAVLALWLRSGEFVFVDPDPEGDLAGSSDEFGFAWVHPAGPGTVLEAGELPYRDHAESCPVPVQVASLEEHRRRRFRWKAWAGTVPGA